MWPGHLPPHQLPPAQAAAVPRPCPRPRPQPRCQYPRGAGGLWACRQPHPRGSADAKEAQPDCQVYRAQPGAEDQRGEPAAEEQLQHVSAAAQAEDRHRQERGAQGRPGGGRARVGGRVRVRGRARVGGQDAVPRPRPAVLLWPEQGTQIIRYNWRQNFRQIFLLTNSIYFQIL